MCNKEIASLSQSTSLFDRESSHSQALYTMGSPSAAPNSLPTSSSGSNPGSTDETHRVKFLCSFLGSIMSRPQDGKLRYVGGETRIVSVSRDITYEELMNKMKEIYEGASLLKYQQPDEDLDALVSVVNDDDVINMMEEYDKLGSGDGITKLRIFLSSHPDLDGSSAFADGDDRDNEKRYVDALNNLNDGTDIRKQQLPDSSVVGPLDDFHGSDQFFNPLSPDGSFHSQRNYDPLTQYNLGHLKIPQHSASQRYNEIEAPWSPGYYSPRHHGPHDFRPMPEFPLSPSSARYRMPFADFPPEDFTRQSVNHLPTFEHQPQFSDNVVWLQNGGVTCEKSGFPGNILHNQSVFDGSNICEHCHMNFQRNQSHLEHSNVVNGLPQSGNQCVESLPGKEVFKINAETKFHHGIFPSDANNDPRLAYSETQNHERGWVLQHQLNMRVEEARAHASGTGRVSDQYIMDGPGLNFPIGHSNLTDSHRASPNLHQRAGSEMGNDVYHDQAIPITSHLHISMPEERVRYGIMPYAYGGDNQYPSVSHGHIPGNVAWRNIPNSLHVAPAPSYEASNSYQQVNGMANSGYVRGVREGNAQFYIGMDNQNSWLDSSQRIGLEGTGCSEYTYGNALRINNGNTAGHENQQFSTLDEIRSTPEKKAFQISDSWVLSNNDKLVFSAAARGSRSKVDPHLTETMMVEVSNIPVEEASNLVRLDSGNAQSLACPEDCKLLNNSFPVVPSDFPICSNYPEENNDVQKSSEEDVHAPKELELSVNNLSFLPDLISSVKRVALEEAEEVAPLVNGSASTKPDSVAKEETGNEFEASNVQGRSEQETDDDYLKPSKIEPTKAEAEAIARGLQTIKNDDLEEIRELGCGTYGAVYHGKWKGSDVAIKRIKASCFAGRPSERERLIADFWKEALILSSLHHPNVVSFYGIVRDGPDGSLATVTEFMINGSLKQFLQKKDRTIDRRKRLIIAMDASFGMEYLHGKNIVHFDLKCENLLVNMRDPQRPVCKIGDLGLSKVRQHTLVSGGVRGTLPWMAPELLSGKSNMVTEKIDVYSFGIVMWEVLTGDEPYADMHCASIIGGIVNNTLRPQIPSWCDPEWKALMESCWDSDPAKRPSFSEISQKLRNMAAAMNLK